MTPNPVVVPPSATVDDAIRLLDGHGIRHLPIVDQGRLVGIVSDRDLRACRPELGVPLSEIDSLFEALERPVAQVATHEVLICGPDGQMGDAIDVMIQHRVGAICVVDDEDRLLGIVSVIDVLRAVKDLVPRGLIHRRTEDVGRVRVRMR